MFDAQLVTGVDSAKQRWRRTWEDGWGGQESYPSRKAKPETLGFKQHETEGIEPRLPPMLGWGGAGRQHGRVGPVQVKPGGEP